MGRHIPDLNQLSVSGQFLRLHNKVLTLLLQSARKKISRVPYRQAVCNYAHDVPSGPKLILTRIIFNLLQFFCNKPFPSCLVPLCQNRSSCKTSCMKMCSPYRLNFMQFKLIFVRKFCMRARFETEANFPTKLDKITERSTGPSKTFFSAPCTQIWCCHRMYSTWCSPSFTAEWFPLLKVNLEFYNPAIRILWLLRSWTGVTFLKAICSSNAHCSHDCLFLNTYPSDTV